MNHFQQAWDRVHDQLVPFFIYGFVGIFLSACVFYIPLLSVLRELKDAVIQDRVPEIKNAFDMDTIKADLPMWAALIGSQLAITLVIFMLSLPLIGVSIVMSGEAEWLVMLLFFAVSGIAALAFIACGILLFWSPWIYLVEQLSPIDSIKASFFYGKSTILQVIIHLLIIYFSTLLSAIFCYIPSFLALTLGAIATFYLYEAHRPAIQKVITERSLSRLKLD